MSFLIGKRWLDWLANKYCVKAQCSWKCISVVLWVGFFSETFIQFLLLQLCYWLSGIDIRAPVNKDARTGVSGTALMLFLAHLCLERMFIIVEICVSGCWMCWSLELLVWIICMGMSNWSDIRVLSFWYVNLLLLLMFRPD